MTGCLCFASTTRPATKLTETWFCAQDAHVHSFHFDDQYYTYHRYGTKQLNAANLSLQQKLVVRYIIYCTVVTDIYKSCQKPAHGTANLPSNLCKQDVALNHFLKLDKPCGLTSLTVLHALITSCSYAAALGMQWPQAAKEWFQIPASYRISN